MSKEVCYGPYRQYILSLLKSFNQKYTHISCYKTFVFFMIYLS